MGELLAQWVLELLVGTGELLAREAAELRNGLRDRVRRRRRRRGRRRS